MTVDEPREGADLAPAPDALDSLDDTTLRAIAYGRAVNDRDRMRARNASQILANRHASVMPGPRGVNDGPGAVGFAVGARPHGGKGGDNDSAGGRSSNASGVVDGRTSGDCDDADPPTSLRRGLLIGAIVAALLAGGAIGVAAGQLGETLQPDSLAVFDRPATDVETAATGSSFGVGTGDARLLVERDGVRVFGVRTTAGLFVSDGELGTQICIVADTEDETVQFFPLNCVPERVFREHGMSGVLPAFERFTESFTPSVTQALAFQWGPRGDLQLEDISADILTATADRFSEQDLLQGLDIPLVQVIREQEPDPAIGREIPGALFGPVDIGTVSAGAGVEARMWGSIAPDSDGSDGVAVCLSAEVEAELVAHECQSMAVFRTEGVDAQFLRGDALITASVGPSGAVSAVIEE